MMTGIRLRKDSSGAVMVMATFFAIFLVALVYHVAGVGGACLEQQIMQDAADATVFSAATVNARGMNLIALINLVMAAILAVLVALRLVQAILTVATAIFVALCAIPWTSAIGCPLITPLAEATGNIADAASEVEDVIDEVLPALHDAAEMVNDYVPYLAEGEAIYVSTQYKPTAEIGFVWPVTDGLPTKEGSFQLLCEKAGGMVVDIAFFYLPDDSIMKDKLGVLMEGLAGTFQSFFCGGDGEGGRPHSEKKVGVSYPAENRDDCSPDGTGTTIADDPSCHDEDGPTGSRDATCDCEGRDACESCSRSGCNYCYDRLSNGNFKNGLWTVQRDRWREYFDEETQTWRFEDWIQQEKRWTSNRKGNPCRGAESKLGCGGSSPSLDRTNDDLMRGDDPPARPSAVCIQEKETDDYTDNTGVSIREMQRVSYVYLHSCQINQSVEIAAKGNPIEGGEDKVPRVLDPERYPEESKMRGVVIGGGKSGERLKGVGVATEERKRGINGRLSVAAADYFSPDNDLWHMTWRARLIRFRMSYEDDDQEGGGGQGGDLGGGGQGGDFGGGGEGGNLGGGGIISPFGGCGDERFPVCDTIQERMFGGQGNEGLFTGGSMGGLDLEEYILH